LATFASTTADGKAVLSMPSTAAKFLDRCAFRVGTPGVRRILERDVAGVAPNAPSRASAIRPQDGD
jgi:hypothetical protein